MRIIVFSFYFGVGNASGFATSKIVSEMGEQGHEIVVVTGISNESIYGKNVKVIICNPLPMSPARILKGLGNLIGRELNYIFWEMRAKKLGDKIIKSFKPELIYGRGSPIASLTVASRLATQHKIPCVAHFADPIPAPKEWVNNVNERYKLINGIMPVLKNCDLLSFVTHDMLLYQEDTSGLNLASKSFISPNPIMEFRKKSVRRSDKRKVFLFLGSFYGNRTPKALLEGFDIYLRKFPDSEMHFYGSNEAFVRKFIPSVLVEEKISFFPQTKQPFDVIENADILIDVDGLAIRQVFLSSKFVDYLSVDRQILSITNRDSPAWKLTLKMPLTSLSVTHDVLEIANAMEILTLSHIQCDDYNERDAIRRYFKSSLIVKRILKFAGRQIDMYKLNRL